MANFLRSGRESGEMYRAIYDVLATFDVITPVYQMDTDVSRWVGRNHYGRDSWEDMWGNFAVLLALALLTAAFLLRWLWEFHTQLAAAAQESTERVDAKAHGSDQILGAPVVGKVLDQI